MGHDYIPTSPVGYPLTPKPAPNGKLASRPQMRKHLPRLRTSDNPLLVIPAPGSPAKRKAVRWGGSAEIQLYLIIRQTLFPFPLFVPISAIRGRPTPLTIHYIMDEQDKLYGERKALDLLIHKFNGKARHSELMNTCHMRKREFSETMESLIDREAVRVETYTNYRHTGKLYVLDPAIIESWSN